MHMHPMPMIKVAVIKLPFGLFSEPPISKTSAKYRPDGRMVPYEPNVELMDTALFLSSCPKNSNGDNPLIGTSTAVKDI